MSVFLALLEGLFTELALRVLAIILLLLTVLTIPQWVPWFSQFLIMKL